MPKGVVKLPPTQVNRARQYNARQIVDLARKHSIPALSKLAQLMDGKGGKMRVLAGESVVEVDIEVPAAVQLKAAELLLERGWGKAPQSILVGMDNPLTGGTGEDGRTLSLPEKIALLRQAMEDKGSTVDLEASEQREVTEVEIVVAAPATAVEDGI